MERYEHELDDMEDDIINEDNELTSKRVNEIRADIRDLKTHYETVAGLIGKAPECVFKTLVARGASKSIYVFVIPVCGELDLKRAAKAAKEKSVEMVHVSEINALTGYVRGGCSPIGMKKQYKTFFDSSCLSLESIVVSAGKIGAQAELSPQELIRLTRAETAALIKET